MGMYYDGELKQTYHLNYLDGLEFSKLMKNSNHVYNFNDGNYSFEKFNVSISVVGYSLKQLIKMLKL